MIYQLESNMKKISFLIPAPNIDKDQKRGFPVLIKNLSISTKTYLFYIIVGGCFYHYLWQKNCSFYMLRHIRLINNNGNFCYYLNLRSKSLEICRSSEHYLGNYSLFISIYDLWIIFNFILNFSHNIWSDFLATVKPRLVSQRFGNFFE